MPPAPLPPAQHLSLRINRAIKVFNRAIAAFERDTFTPHHYDSVREAHHELASLSARCRDARWGNLTEDTTDIMVALTMDMEQLMQDVTQPALHRRDERICHRPGEYTCTRILKLVGVPYRKDIPCANPAYALARLDEWEKQLVATIATDAGATRN